MLNCGHAIAAYPSFAHGLDRIDQAQENTAILQDVRGALRESGVALVRKHGFDVREHEQYVVRVLHRFVNPKLHDDVARVCLIHKACNPKHNLVRRGRHGRPSCSTITSLTVKSTLGTPGALLQQRPRGIFRRARIKG
jgi:hypothetical protein